ncbi:MAG TPA: InlB B-repeat-containing protein, partial [Acidimicrobiia bacterium]
AVASLGSCTTDEWGTSGAGGLGGGATGASATSVNDKPTAASGTDGLGGGGGGAATVYTDSYKNRSQGGDGGDGVVVVRYLTNWISISAGDNQSGLPSQALGTDPQVQVTNADGTGVDGVTVTFAVATGGGSVGSASVTTSGGGYASTPWTLGNASATQTLTARATAVGGSPVTFTASTLYTLTYDANGGASPPTTQTGVDGADLTVAAQGSMSRAGYLFDAWNTAADGSGTVYNPTDTYTMSAADVTLYAQWTPDIQTLSYSANGGSGAPAPVMTVSGGQVTVSATTPTRTGHTFDAWNTAVGGTGDEYNAGEIVTMPAADVTLYAQWTPNTYTISYNANGGTGAPNNAPGTYGTSFTVSSTEPNRTGYTFNGWNTEADGSGISWNAERTFTVLGDVDLHAQWVADNFTLIYNANGGSGAPGPEEVATGTSVSISTTEPTRVGYTFDKWTTEVAGGGDAYSNPSKTGTSDQIASMPASDVTLFAQWDAIPYSITYAANGASGSVPNPQTNLNYLGSVTASSASSLTYAGHTFLGWN